MTFGLGEHVPCSHGIVQAICQDRSFPNLKGLVVDHLLVVAMEEEDPLLAQSLLQQGKLPIDVLMLSLAVCL